jgi:hypothetical protein
MLSQVPLTTSPPTRTQVKPKAGPPVELSDIRQAEDSFDLNNYRGLSVDSDELKRGGALVRKALKELGPPQIYVNRSLSSALSLLEKGGNFPTIHQTIKDPSLTQEARSEISAYLEGRVLREKRLNTFGVGQLEGHTVYGSLGFSKEISKELWQDGILDAAKGFREPRSTHLNDGISLTGGAVTFVLKSSANRHATFLPSDTYDNYGEKPVALKHLPYAIWANIGSKGDGYFKSRRGSQVLLDLPTDQAVHGVKRFLTSEAINRGYMEAQVRGARLEEVERIVVRRENAWDGHFPDETSFNSAVEKLMQLAEQRGIPCEESRPA